MTSLQTSLKQIPLNMGYYINVGDCRTRFYQNNGTDELPRMSTNVYAQSTMRVGATVGTVSSILSTNMATPGGVIFRDMGKTQLSSGRVFRKVQLMFSTNDVYPDLGTDGVGGFDSAPTNYATGYIELPGQGTGSGIGAGCTPVARLG
jgi:hypothetical protein